jgi:hypothetical protein
MLYGPIEDPRRFYERRMACLEEQVNDPDSSQAGIDTAVLKDNANYFRNGVLDARQVCLAAMHIYWSWNYKDIEPESADARHNLATLGHDVGAYAAIGFGDLQQMWQSAQDYQKNPVHRNL